MNDRTRTTDNFAVSLECKRDVNLSMPWFVENSKYPPRCTNHIEPLINGERAFGAVYEAIANAKVSVDIVSWGFDPGMRLTRPGGERLGDLLKRRSDPSHRYGSSFGDPVAQVRVLIWKNALANFAENNIIGDGLGGSGGTAAGSGVASGSAGGGSPSEDGFNNYGSGKTNSAAIIEGEDDAREYVRNWYKYLPTHMEFRTRDFSLGDRLAIAGHQIAQRGLSNPTRSYLMTDFASHHQKMILVDYENPEDAIGFVMGHNLLRNYWDTDDHDYFSALRGGFAPWQDLSCRIRGPALFDLHENFKTAWERAEGSGSRLSWSAERLARKAEDFIEPAQRHGATHTAQICRTQPQEGDRSILESYKLALQNARRYVYFENQYFRYREFAELLKQQRRDLRANGDTRELYIFVVTNVTDGTGRLNTYEMLQALGKGSQMPTVNGPSTAGSNSGAILRNSDLEGINIHVATLLSSGNTPQGVKYKDVYVHSKLLLVDDVFFTLGSANINTRSMEGDSELNISCPSPGLTRDWREHLWKLHTGLHPSDRMSTEFKIWGEVMSDNAVLRANNTLLLAPLVEFFDDGAATFAPD